MSNACSTNGNLALKPAHGNARLAVVKGLGSKADNAYARFCSRAFGYLSSASVAGSVASVLEGRFKYRFLVGPKERRFALAVSCVGTAALFWLSFFA